MTRIFTFIFVLTFLCSTAQVFNGTPAGIPNNGQFTSFYLNVSGLSQNLDSSFGLAKVNIDISHPAVQQLYIFLQSPSGIRVNLTIGNSSYGSNFTNVCFDDRAADSYTTAGPPYTGTHKAIGRLGRVNNGSSGNGTWKLIIQDWLAHQDSGVINSWSLTFGNNPPVGVALSSSNLPLVVLNTNNQSIGDSKIMADMGIIDNGGNRNNIDDPKNNYNGRVRIHTRGNSSKDFEKKSYTLELKDAGNNTTDASLLGMPADNDWVLISFYQDKSLVRDPLAFHIFEQMGRYSPRFKPVELILNNEYRGVYLLAEKIKRSSSRLDIAKLDSNDTDFPQVTGGYVFKIDRDDEMGWSSLMNGHCQANTKFYYQYVYPKDSDILAEQKSYIKSYMDNFETVMNSASYADPINGYSKYMDVASFVDYFIFTELSKNVDGYRFSTYLYKEKVTDGGKLVAGPVWDNNLSWHNCNYGDAFSYTGWQFYLQDTVHPAPVWWNKLFQDTNFVNRVYCRWFSLRQNVLRNDNLYAYIDSLRNVLEEAQQRNFIQWPVLGANVFPNPQDQNGATYQGEVNDVKSWLANRMEWLDSVIQGRCLPGDGLFETKTNASLTLAPNPVTSEATFTVITEKSMETNLSITDVFGRELKSIYKGNLPAGAHEFSFNKGQLVPGIYFYKMITDKQILSGKIIIQ